MYTMLRVVLNITIGINTTLDITYLSDGCESAIILHCKMHVMVEACKLYIKS
jgi:hypothetical protein